MKVAVVHDWLTGMRGGERVLEEILALFPRADIHTLLHVPGSVSASIEARPIRTSFLQRLPGAAERYRLAGYDLVISSSHCAAKAVLTDPPTAHACYCHTPMRYAWDQFDAYFNAQRNGRVAYAAIAATMAWLRRWDRATAGRVDAFAANSAFVAQRIERYYGRAATVVPPPVDTDFFVPAPDAGAGDYWLVVSALSPYKRTEIVIEAFNRMGRPLLVVGQGPDAARLAALAGPTVRLLGHVDADQLRRLYQGCRGLVLAAVEDAGIVPLEAMACGRPAVVLAEGGAREAVVDGVTGILIERQDPQAVVRAVDRAEATAFNTEEIRTAAQPYARDRFRDRFAAFIAAALDPPPSRRVTSAPRVPAARQAT